MKIIVLVLLALCIMSVQACEKRPQNPPELKTAKPESVGISPQKLAAIDSLIEKAIAEQIVPGTVVLVAKDGKVVYHKAFGRANLDRPMTTDTIFQMYSSSKIVTSVAVMQLVEQGKLHLDDPISMYIPEFASQSVKETLPEGSNPPFRLVPARSAPTLRQALSMTTGIVGYMDTGFIHYGVDIGIGDPDFDLAENMRRLARMPLEFQPGTQFGYGLSNDVAGRMIEVASGMSLAEYYQRHIFGPLGMQDSFFYPPAEKASRVAPSWEGDGRRLTGKVVPYTFKNRRLYSSGNGLFTTTSDYSRLGQMLLDGGEYGGVRILKPESVNEIRTNQISELQGVESFVFFQKGYDRYGLGCFINGKGSVRDPGSISVLGLGGKNLDLNFERRLMVLVMQTVFPPQPAWEISEEVSRLVSAALK
ncbi:serine hydrolase domain-containing protein [Solidesulfovibrio alcoholivorans]|uniref:serine hydrolase domain-containing protein n=1 Tax=Solidesulfovibrio alcoholivorans TaxID=81406 RepID=UPI000494DCB4|nr:serine hydrolase domain-containing protein [Solidesulfovibrio alcoholivorans]